MTKTERAKELFVKELLSNENSGQWSEELQGLINEGIDVGIELPSGKPYSGARR